MAELMICHQMCHCNPIKVALLSWVQPVQMGKGSMSPPETDPSHGWRQFVDSLGEVWCREWREQQVGGFSYRSFAYFPGLTCPLLLLGWYTRDQEWVGFCSSDACSNPNTLHGLDPAQVHVDFCQLAPSWFTGPSVAYPRIRKQIH